MHSIDDYRTAARRVLDETRHLEGSWRLEAWRHLTLSLSPELAAALGELVALADHDAPMQALPGPAPAHA